MCALTFLNLEEFFDGADAPLSPDASPPFVSSSASAAGPSDAVSKQVGVVDAERAEHDQRQQQHDCGPALVQATHGNN